jgi:hypothetical protein
MVCCKNNLRGLHAVVIVFFVIHGVLEPASAIFPSAIGFVSPSIYFWLFGNEFTLVGCSQLGLVKAALNYGFRDFSSLNSFAGYALLRVVSWPLVSKGYYTPEEYSLVVAILIGLLVLGDSLYSLSSFLAKSEYPGLSWRIYVPVALDAILVGSKVVFLLFALVRKYGGVKKPPTAASRLLTESSNLLP